MTTGMSRRQSACNACILKQARWCVCACLCVSVRVGGLIYVYLASFTHSNDAWYHIFIYSSQKWHPPALVRCSTFVVIPLISQSDRRPGVRPPRSKGGGLYDNQTLVKTSCVSQRDVHIKVSPSSPTQKKKCREGLEIRGRSQPAGLWLRIFPSHSVMWADEKVSKIRGITHPSTAFPWSNPHDWHISPLAAACSHQDSTIKASNCLGCKQTIRSATGNISPFQSSRATMLFILAWCWDELVNFCECALNSIMIIRTDRPSARRTK